MYILLTGATGFVGQQVLTDLLQRQAKDMSLSVAALVRPPADDLPASVQVISQPSIETYRGADLPAKVDVIIHLVAKAHVVATQAAHAEYQRVNVQGTQAICQVALAKQTQHVIYVSTIKVNGEGEHGVMTEQDPPNPQGIYATTKYQAEHSLQALTNAGVRVSVVRPPLVYGPGVKANMAAIIKLVQRLPCLPFGRIANRRSLISVRNLSDFILTLCFSTPKQDYTQQVFIVADRSPISTPRLCTWIAQGLQKTRYQLPIPAGLLQGLMRLLGRGAQCPIA